MIAYCRCGCPRRAHKHWRHGRDCGRCGGRVCPRFRWRWLSPSWLLRDRHVAADYSESAKRWANGPNVHWAVPHGRT